MMRTVTRLRLAAGLYGLVFGFALATIGFIVFMRQSIIVEQISPYDFATTMTKLKAGAAEKGWYISEMDQLHGALIKAGAPDVSAVQVIEMCPPDHACDLLKSGKRSCLALLPCSVAVYQRNGKVYVASLNRGMIGRFFRHEAFGILKEVRNDEREILHLAVSR
jgi:uncharacterized protein (DUF302 family)